METREIDAEMKDYDCYIGTFARDLMPKYKIYKRPLALIMNTDISSKPGQHWVALFIDENNIAEYLDSYGYSPLWPEILRFLKTNNVKLVQYNEHQLQSVMTSTCGAYCILFIKMRCKSFDYCSFIKLFTKNKLANDLIVTELIK